MYMLWWLASDGGFSRVSYCYYYFFLFSRKKWKPIFNAAKQKLAPASRVYFEFLDWLTSSIRPFVRPPSRPYPAHPLRESCYHTTLIWRSLTLMLWMFCMEEYALPMYSIDIEAFSHTFGAVFSSKSQLAVTNIVTHSLITSSSILTDIVGHWAFFDI